MALDERLVLSPLRRKFALDLGHALLHARLLGEHFFAVQAPLDLIGLECIAICRHDSELLAQPGQIGRDAGDLGLAPGGLLLSGRQPVTRTAQLSLGRPDRLPRLVTVGGDLVALLLDAMDCLADVRQARVQGLDLGAKLVRFGVDRLPFAGPPPGRLFVAGQFGRQRLGERFDAREELPPVIDGFAERAGEVRRVRHAPITVGCHAAGTLAIFGSGRRFGLAGGDFRHDEGAPLRIARPRCGKPARLVVMAQDLVTKGDAQVADIDLAGARHQPHLTLLFATKRATRDRPIHAPDYRRASIGRAIRPSP